MFELITLVLGSALLLGAVVIVVGMRQPRSTATPRPEGLLAPERSLEPPAGHSPGTVGPLRDSHVDQRDVRLTLLDLASRGYLRITVLTDDQGRRYDWVLRRTEKSPEPTLRPFEQALLTVPFSNAGRSSVTMSGLAGMPGQPMNAAEVALGDHLRHLGWFSPDGRTRHSPWGWIGALMLLAGLLITAYMLIDWLATGDFRGIIGGFFIGTAGVLLASRGRRHTPQTDAGAVAREQADSFREAIDDLGADQVDPERTSDTFARLLPWAVAFGNHEKLAGVVDDLLRRASGWGRAVDLSVGWLTTDREDGPVTAAEIAAEAQAFANQRPALRANRRRLAAADGRLDR